MLMVGNTATVQGEKLPRMKKVEDYMKNEMQDSLAALGKALLPRAEDLKKRQGERIPK